MAGGPRVGGGIEKYLTPVVTVPPNSATDEYGVQIGTFEADANNSDLAVAVGAAGTISTGKKFGLKALRLGQLINPYVEIRDPVTGKVRRRRTKTRTLGRRRQLAHLPEPAAPVPRFGVQVLNPGETVGASWLGLRQDFSASGTPAFADINKITGGPSDPGYREPCLVDDGKGRLVLCLLEALGTVDYAVHIKRWSPATQTDWQQVYTETSLNTLTASSATHTAQDCIHAALFRGEIYILVTRAALFHLLRLTASDTLENVFATLLSMAFTGLSDLVATDTHLVSLAVADLNLGGASQQAFIVARSADGRTWTSDPSGSSTAVQWYAVATSQGDVTVREVTSGDDYINAMSFASSTVGWAFGTGAIWHTSNGGTTWQPQAIWMPRLLGGFALDASRIWAVGTQGTIMRTTDGGITWRFLYSENEDISVGRWQDGNRQRVAGLASNINDIVFRDANTGWLVTDHGQVWRTTDGGLNWTKIRDQGGGAHYHAVALYGTNGLVIVGEPDQQQAGKRIVQTADATVPSPVWVVDDLSSPGPEALYGLTRRVGTSHGQVPATCYACGTAGVILKYVPATNAVAEELDSGERITDRSLHAATWVDAAGTYAFAGRYGTIVRHASGAGYTVQRLDGMPVLNAIYQSAAGVGSVSGEGFFQFSSVAFQDFYGPCGVVLESGRIVAAAYNADAGYVQTFVSDDDGASFRQIELESAATLLRGGAGDLRPALTLADTGEVLLVVGDSQAGIISIDDGESWVAYNSPSAQLPLGTNPDTATYDTANFLACVAFGGGRLFQVSVSKTGGEPVRTWVSRDWVAGSTLYQPVIPGQAQWIGHDDARAIWSGFPQLDDLWTAEPRYDYARSHLLIDSPAIYTRTTDTSQVAYFDWDRQDATIEQALGNTARWELTGFALFGTNFRRALVQLSIPSYGGSVPPTSPADYVEFELTADVAGPILIATADGPRVTFSGQNFERDQFGPGARTYWAINHTTTAGGTVNGIWKILGNSKNDLYIERSSESAMTAYITIITDRMVNLGANGDLNGTPIADLRSSNYRFPRFVRLIVPATNINAIQAFADAYAKIGTVILGVHDFDTAPDGAERSTRVPFLEGFGWQPIANTIAETGITGITSLRHYGRPGQRWTLPEIGEAYQRDQVLRSLRTKLMQPFCLVFESNFPTRSAELVRLVETPISTNVARDWSRRALQLVEVV